MITKNEQASCATKMTEHRRCFFQHLLCLLLAVFGLMLGAGGLLVHLWILLAAIGGRGIEIISHLGEISNPTYTDDPNFGSALKGLLHGAYQSPQFFASLALSIIILFFCSLLVSRTYKKIEEDIWVLRQMFRTWVADMLPKGSQENHMKMFDSTNGLENDRQTLISNISRLALNFLAPLILSGVSRLLIRNKREKVIPTTARQVADLGTSQIYSLIFPIAVAFCVGFTRRITARDDVARNAR